MSERISRRAFMGRLATFAGTLALHNLGADVPLHSANLKVAVNANNDEILDVAIVGGGVSGIYSGWRLLVADPSRPKILGRPAGNGRKLSVNLFEGTRRLGA